MKVFAKLTPLLVIVFPVAVALKVIVPVYVRVIPESSNMLPEMAMAEEPAQVMVPETEGAASNMRSSMVAEDSMVTVYAVVLLSALKWALSAAVGTLPSAGAPPEVAAQ